MNKYYACTDRNFKHDISATLAVVRLRKLAAAFAGLRRGESSSVYKGEIYSGTLRVQESGCVRAVWCVLAGLRRQRRRRASRELRLGFIRLHATILKFLKRLDEIDNPFTLNGGCTAYSLDHYGEPNLWI